MLEFFIPTKKISFKNLVSGPAPIGRIFNYINLIGINKLKYKLCYRKTDLKDMYGSSWCIDFMIGLDLVHLTKIDKNKESLKLTKKGLKIFELINQENINFDETNNIENFKNSFPLGVEKYEHIKDIFLKIFLETPIFLNLKKFLEHKMKMVFKKKEFINEYYDSLYAFYYNNDNHKNKKGKRTTKTKTEQNRVPSLLQVCQFLGILKIEKDLILFNFDQLNISSNIKNKNNDEKIKIDNSNDAFFKKTSLEIIEIFNKYGIDGNVIKKITTRNNILQNIFRDSLLKEFGENCCICGENIKEMLIASHIIPSSESNSYWKLNKNNGLLLCSMHDKLFDRHLISFDYNFKIVFNHKLDKYLDKYKIDKNFILKTKVLTKDRKKNLNEHFETFKKLNF